METILVGVLLVLGGFWILSSRRAVVRSGFVQSLRETWTKYGYRDSFQFRPDGSHRGRPIRWFNSGNLRRWLKHSTIGVGLISAGTIAIYGALGNLRLQAQPSVPSICPKVLPSVVPSVVSAGAPERKMRSASAKRPANFVFSGYRQVDEQIHFACVATQNYQYRLALNHFKSAWSVNHDLRKKRKAYVLDKADQSIKSAIKQVERQTR